jgi:hypothetical protein
MGFGIMASVATNSVAAFAALANALLPLRRVGRPDAGTREWRETREGSSATRHAISPRIGALHRKKPWSRRSRRSNRVADLEPIRRPSALGERAGPPRVGGQPSTPLLKDS